MPYLPTWPAHFLRPPFQALTTIVPTFPPQAPRFSPRPAISSFSSSFLNLPRLSSSACPSPSLSSFSHPPPQPHAQRPVREEISTSSPGETSAQFEFEHCSGSGAQLFARLAARSGLWLEIENPELIVGLLAAQLHHLYSHPKHGRPDSSPVIPSWAGRRPQLAGGQSRLRLRLHRWQQA